MGGPTAEEITDGSSDCDDDDPEFCSRLGNTYCSEGKFALTCRRTCDLCPPAGAPDHQCIDQFGDFTCGRYKSYGWCSRKDTRATVELKCPVTCGLCSQEAQKATKTTTRRYLVSRLHPKESEDNEDHDEEKEE